MVEPTRSSPVADHGLDGRDRQDALDLDRDDVLYACIA